VMIGSLTVLINSMMACRVNDPVVEIPGGPNPILMGATNVCIGDAGTVSPGAPGPAVQRLAASLAAMPDAAAAQAQTLIEAAKGGVPFCEKCQHVTDRQTASPASAGQTADETDSDASDAPAAAEQLIPLSAFVHDEFGIPQEGVLVEVS